MEITATSAFSGPSVHALRPAVRHTLGGLDRWPPGYPDASFLEDLGRHLPGLAAHWEACDPVVEGAPAHLLEHVCIELLRLAGCETECVRTAAARPLGPAEAVVAGEDAGVCSAAAALGASLLSSLLPAELPSASAQPQPFDMDGQLRDFLRRAEQSLLPVQDRELVRTARACDVPVTRLAGRIIQLGQGRYQQRLSATKTSHTSAVGNDLAANKDYARRVLADLGLPVPRYERVYRAREAIEAARRIGYPVVVKPNNGSMGGGVSVGMRNRRQVRAAFKRAQAIGRSTLVEEVVEGSDYRMLVIDGRLCAAAQRIPAHVVGDGKHSIEELVEEVNLDPRRGSGPNQSWTRIALDAEADRVLAAHGHDRRTVPPPGQTVYLRRNANTSDGGSAVDVTDRVHPDNREIAERAARAIGLDVAGVDLLTTDISGSIWEIGGSICEINSRPGLRKHIWPAVGTPRDVTTPIVRMLYPAGSRSRVPVVALCGTDASAAAARRLADLLTAAGHHVGLATRHRVYIQGRRTGPPRLTAAAAARLILLDPDVDVAVLEMSADDVVRHGMGCDVIDVAVIPDPAAVDGAAGDADSGTLHDALSLLTRVTRGVVLVHGAGGAGSELEPAAEVAALRCATLDGSTLHVREPGGERREIRVSGPAGDAAAGEGALLAHAVLRCLDLDPGHRPGAANGGV